MNETEIFIVVADNGCVYAVKAKSQQESLDLVVAEQGCSPSEIASRKLEDMFRVCGPDSVVTMVN